MEEEKARWEADRDARETETIRVTERQQADERRRSSLAERVKRAGETLKNVLPKMPGEYGDIPLFFDNVENLFTIFEIDNDLRSKLLMPLLTVKARSIVGRLPAAVLDDYVEVKRFLLAEFKLTAKEYRSRFLSAVKQTDETYLLFASRLTSLFKYYTASRELGHSYDELCKVLVADQLKTCLPPAALQYVLSLEGDKWFDASKVAGLADVYVTNTSDRATKTRPSGNGDKQSAVPVEDTQAYGRGAGPTVGQGQGRGKGGGTPEVERTPGKAQQRFCYNCRSPFHLAKNCDQPRRGGGGGNRGPVNTVNACTIKSASAERSPMGLATAVDSGAWAAELPGYDCEIITTLCDCNATPSSGGLKISPLQYIDIVVDGEKRTAMIDSGAQIPIVKRAGLKNIIPVGRVQVQGVVGEPVTTPLVALDIKLARTPTEGCVLVEQTLNVVCAVNDNNTLSCDIILPPDVVDELKALTACEVLECKTPDISANAVCDDDIVSCDDLLHVNAATAASRPMTPSADALAAEQRADDSLAEAFKLANDGKAGYSIHNALLYHQDKIATTTVQQLVVPIGRRIKVMEMAHNTIFSCHLRNRKTLARIRMSFYWPTIRRDVEAFCASCTECQLKARARTDDRVPITPVARAPLPFHTWNMDVIGPIQDNGPYRWILTLVDSCTRWPSVYLLRSLAAKPVCDALLNLFAQCGIASVIICDNGSNFTSSLTQECLKRLGCTPRFLTPAHPEASGMVERFNSTFKTMLHHVVRDHPKSWYKLVPLLVWSLREVPGATTGLAPFQMVYGRLPRGILTLLKESWADEIDVPPNLTQTAVEYLQELKENLELAADYAAQHAEVAQQRYAHHYNLRARDKSFIAGEQVVVLTRDSTNKVYSQWKMGTVAKVLSPHSYLVDMKDGGRHHLHANHMRKFVARVQTVGVITDEDDFGQINYPPSRMVGTEALPSLRVDPAQVGHLPIERRREIVSILDEFADVFSEKPGLCAAVKHEIVTVPEFKPKSFKAYRIPEILKAEVDRQIQQLLEWGFIRPSESPMASPIVCVVKKDGSIRMAVNYQYLNAYTVADAYPMPCVDDVMYKVAQANYISCFDATAGFWQLKMHEASAWLTGFATHSGLFEWLRCPFGLKNSAAKFVRMMQIVLRPINDYATAYVDDTGVHSQDWPQHLRDLVAFLTVMRNANLTLNLKKSSFANREIKMVGHYVGSGTHRPDPERLTVIQNLTRPETKTEVRRLLGMFGYYRTYIAGFARLAKPLTDLTGADKPPKLVWGENQQRAFDSLRQAICTTPILCAPKFGKPFFLQTDACGVSVGCCLGQWDDDQNEHPIAFASKKLSSTQCAWATIEREAYAVIWGLQKYRDLIFGTHVTVFVDHNPLTYLTDTAPKSAKLTRWLLALQEFTVTLTYKKGVQNKVADFLSRIG